MKRRQGRPIRHRLPPARRRALRVGLLGGSFNPAHAGHLHISLQAIARLGLDEVWWVVSPQNPLKATTGMAPFDERLAAARMVARHPRIVVSDIEARLGTRYTARTLARLRATRPRVSFVWLMGGDLLPEMKDWRDWPAIFRAAPVAIFDRWPYAQRAPASKAAQRFAWARRPERTAPTLAGAAPPAWIYFHSPLHPASATALRSARSPCAPDAPGETE